jgi:S-adenosylmethionine hydrolase
VRGRRLVANGRRIAHKRVFSEATDGEAFWYENSIGLIEIAANASNAAVQLGLQIGQSLAVETS